MQNKACAVFASSRSEVIWSSHLNVFPSDLLSSRSFSILIDNAKVCTSPVCQVALSCVIESRQDPPFRQPSSALKTLKTRHLGCAQKGKCLPPWGPHSAVQTRALSMKCGFHPHLQSGLSRSLTALRRSFLFVVLPGSPLMNFPLPALQLPAMGIKFM